MVQGGFGALLVPQGIGILTTTFPRELMGKARFGPAMGASAIAGPVLAGFVIDANLLGLGWRPIFLINILLGSAGLLAAVKVLPRDGPNPDTVIDSCGAGLLGATMLGLMYGLIDGSTNRWTAVPILSLIAGVALFVAFAVRQRVAADPLIIPSLLTNQGFTAGMLLGLFLLCRHQRSRSCRVAIPSTRARTNPIADLPRPDPDGRRHRHRGVHQPARD